MAAPGTAQLQIGAEAGHSRDWRARSSRINTVTRAAADYPGYALRPGDALSGRRP
jgi:hypothetical protein